MDIDRTWMLEHSSAEDCMMLQGHNFHSNSSSTSLDKKASRGERMKISQQGKDLDAMDGGLGNICHEVLMETAPDSDRQSGDGSRCLQTVGCRINLQESDNLLYLYGTTDNGSPSSQILL
ncbi:unnamed protein product [Pleuronectes platessa]|uniref:Uncharacterized protein n=1 Tax=Pleuronectes platessa TaxID=8262 RepID=A0A9N7TXJ3_PLEPL|nr:unnamed protein product [Pleuronectes platessa]